MAATPANMESVSQPRRCPRVSAAGIFAAGCVVSLTLNWPGQLSYDSIVQLHEGRAGHYNAWHPPVMAWMLGLADWLVPGTGLFILFDTLLLTASLVSILWLARQVSWSAVLVAAAFIALPQFVLYQGIVWKDVLFADVAIAGFLVLAHAAARWKQTSLRSILIAGSFLLLALATLVRQNGALALAFGAVALVAVERKNGLRWPKAALSGFVVALAAVCAVLAASLALETRTGGSTGTPGQIKLLQLYDLVGVVKTDPSVQLDGLARADPDLDKSIRADGVLLYTPARNDTLARSARVQKAFVSTSPAAIAAQWREVVAHHTSDYLRVRAHVFAWTFFTPDLVQCDAWYTGVIGPQNYLHQLGLVRRIRPQDRALANYAALFVSTPVFSHAASAALAIVLAVFLLWRRRAVDLVVAAMLVAALVFAGSFFVISIACDYRYLLFLDLAAVTGLFYSVATWHD